MMEVVIIPDFELNYRAVVRKTSHYWELSFRKEATSILNFPQRLIRTSVIVEKLEACRFGLSRAILAP